MIRFYYESMFNTFNYKNILNFDVKLIPVTCDYFADKILQKKIRQSFINDQEECCWWQTGKFISYDSGDITTSFSIKFFY